MVVRVRAISLQTGPTAPLDHAQKGGAGLQAAQHEGDVLESSRMTFDCASQRFVQSATGIFQRIQACPIYNFDPSIVTVNKLS